MATRRVNLPKADDLFRPTGQEAAAQTPPAPRKKAAAQTGAEAKRPSGRVRHDEKMTVYVTSEELLDLEHARLTLRREHGLAVDRGRLVREAIAIVLAGLESDGAQSALVRRLREQ